MAPADAPGAIFVLVQRHGQTHGEKSLVRFSRSAKTIAACVPEETCQTDQNVSDGDRGQAICEGDAHEQIQDRRGYIAER